MKIQRTAMTIIVVFAVFYLLYVGQSLLLPLVIAGAVAYLINLLTHSICLIKIKDFSVPRPLAILFAIVVILTSLGLVIQLIKVNMTSLIKEVPGYQQNLVTLVSENFDSIGIDRIYTFFGMEEVPEINQILNNIDVGSYLKNFTGTLSDLVNRTGIIFVYLLFLLLEQRTFGVKIKALVKDPDRLEEVFHIIDKIRSDIRSYIGIKVLTSTVTAMLSYFILRLVEVDFASFWAVLIFFLNFIPTIGSIVATAFPSLLTLVQFNDLGPFIITTTLLVAVQFCIGSLIEPRLMGSRLNLSPIVILLSLGLWSKIWGIPGMFLCVPITVIIVIIFSYFPSTRPIAILLSGNGELTTMVPKSKAPGAEA